MKPRMRQVKRDMTITVNEIARIATFIEDRYIIRHTIVATLFIPAGEHVIRRQEIKSIAPGRFAVTVDNKVIPNIGDGWRIEYHVRTYQDRQV